MVIFYSYELMDNDGLTYSHVEMAHRNRWFTELNSMVIFHGYMLNNQMVMENHL